MKQRHKNNNSFTDALAMDVRYALLTKAGRIQILIKPSAKKLRKRGKKGWHLFSTVESRVDATQLLNEAIARALAEVERTDNEAEPVKTPKMKLAKVKAAAATE